MTNDVPVQSASHLVLVGGYAGSGKSTFAEALAKKTSWAIADKDTATRPIVERTLEVLGASPNDRESKIYLQLVQPFEHQALTDLILYNAHIGTNLIAVSPFVSEFQNQSWINAVKSACTSGNVKLTIAWLHCNPNAMQSQLISRGTPRDKAKLDNWETYSANLDNNLRPVSNHVVIHNSRGILSLTQKAETLKKRILGGFRNGEPTVI